MRRRGLPEVIVFNPTEKSRDIGLLTGTTTNDAMSATTAKVSRKGNSNHDAADDTSGTFEEWTLLCTTPSSSVISCFVF